VRPGSLAAEGSAANPDTPTFTAPVEHMPAERMFGGDLGVAEILARSWVIPFRLITALCPIDG